MQTELSEKQKAIIPIAAFTAGGDLEKLKPSLDNGLESGLTVNAPPPPANGKNQP